MKLILIFFIFTLTFHCCSYCLRYGICVDTLSLTAFCISCCFVASIVEAKLAVGFFSSAMLRFSPGTLCGLTSAEI